VTASAATVAGQGAVSYTAVIEVDNPQGRLKPGGTALITVPGQERRNVLRVPSNALSFRPNRKMLETHGERAASRQDPNPAAASASDRSTRRATVWTYEGGKFVRFDVRTGLADDRWTEVVSGALRPGDHVVTSAR
jgi:HlyD family secretion protein